MQEKQSSTKIEASTQGESSELGTPTGYRCMLRFQCKVGATQLDRSTREYLDQLVSLKIEEHTKDHEKYGGPGTCVAYMNYFDVWLRKESDREKVTIRPSSDNTQVLSYKRKEFVLPRAEEKDDQPD